MSLVKNRALYDDRLQMAVYDALRSNEGVAALVIDASRIMLGSGASSEPSIEEAILGIGEHLASVVRPDETVARLDARRFGVVLRGFSNAQQIVTRCNHVMGALKPPRAPSSSTLAASMGVAVFPRDSTSAPELLRLATEACASAASQAAPSAIRYQAPEMEARSQLRGDLEANLREAMNQQRLRLHYQPKVSLGSKMVSGAEALLRWNDAVRGAIPPNEFIPVAEETDLILGLGSWVLDRACGALAERTRLGYEEIPVSINVSTRQFQQQDVPELVQRALDRSGVDPSLLQLEITEGLLVGDTGRMLHCLSYLRDMGLKLALDDFGRGYSSLDRLKTLPLDYVKIDQSFIRGMQEDDRDQAVVESIVRMSHRLGFRVIAEGVENAWQAAFLTDIGCDEAQGYLFRRPMAEEEFTCLKPRTAWSKSDVDLDLMAPTRRAPPRGFTTASSAPEPAP